MKKKPYINDSTNRVTNNLKNNRSVLADETNRIVAKIGEIRVGFKKNLEFSGMSVEMNIFV